MYGSKKYPEDVCFLDIFYIKKNSGLCECLIIVVTRTPVAGAEGSTQTEPTFRCTNLLKANKLASSD